MCNTKHFTYTLYFLLVAIPLHSYFYTNFTRGELELQLKLPSLMKNWEIALGSGWCGSNVHTNPLHCCSLCKSMHFQCVNFRWAFRKSGDLNGMSLAEASCKCWLISTSHATHRTALHLLGALFFSVVSPIKLSIMQHHGCFQCASTQRCIT